jgi:uncharacterized protein (TIGR00369 family)
VFAAEFSFSILINRLKLTVSEMFEPSTYFGLDIPYLKFLGVEPVLCEDDRAVTRLKIREDLLNSRRAIHGGALMSLLDFTLSAAGRSVDPLGLGMATIDITVSCFEPAVTDLTIQARCLRRGSSIAFCEGEVLDTEGKLIAKASASFKVLKVKYPAKVA